MPENAKVSTITRRYRYKLATQLDRHVSQEQFGEMLAEGLLNTGIDRRKIANWEVGDAEPDWNFILSLYAYHFDRKSDWRFRFAVDCLKAMKPEVFESGLVALAEATD